MYNLLVNTENFPVFLSEAGDSVISTTKEQSVSIFGGLDALTLELRGVSEHRDVHLIITWNLLQLWGILDDTVLND